MDRIQEEVFYQTKRLAGTINLIRIFFYTVISATMLILVLTIFNMISLEMALIAFAISLLYSFLRDYSITKYSNKQLDKYYEYAEKKHDDLQLFVPLMEKTYQGYFLKRAALIIDGKQLYLEAFRQKKNQKQDQISIPVKYGEKFIIDHESVDKHSRSITMDSTFSGQYYRFTIVNHQEMLNQINQAKRGGK